MGCSVTVMCLHRRRVRALLQCSGHHNEPPVRWRGSGLKPYRWVLLTKLRLQASASARRHVRMHQRSPRVSRRLLHHQHVQLHYGFGSFGRVAFAHSKGQAMRRPSCLCPQGHSPRALRSRSSAQ